ncbi:hypothetical protein RND81_11G000700 [Saponaria officinalis]|uniref:AAA+ ATPase domain-containing protein n=1 Tax=Saponaria officinalis TaxID=3572 RepID=A0AAW1HFX9_SAPOF
MVERFFKGGGGSSSEKEREGITLLTGPPSCGKTSLLFQYALNLLSSNSNSDASYVVFICVRSRLQSHPPFLSQGIHPCSHLFRRIHIKYVDESDAVSLKKYFAAFHLLSPFPLAVIVDDFSLFFPLTHTYNNARGRDLAMLRVLALSHSALLHANKTSPCHLLFSDTHHHGDSPNLFISNTCLSSIFTVQAHASASFLLRNTLHIKGNDKPYNTTATYSIALQYLLLEQLSQFTCSV